MTEEQDQFLADMARRICDAGYQAFENAGVRITVIVEDSLGNGVVTGRPDVARTVAAKLSDGSTRIVK